VVLKARRHVQQVIVVDDGSTDENGITGREGRGDSFASTAYRGKAAAINAGFALAREMNAAACCDVGW